MIPIIAVTAKVLAATLGTGAAAGAAAGALVGSRFPHATKAVARSAWRCVGKASEMVAKVAATFSQSPVQPHESADAEKEE